MPASTYPEFNAAVTDLTTQVNTLLVDVAALQGVANVQVAVTKAAEASASATTATSAKVTAVSAKTAAEAARDVATAARDTAVTAASALTGNLVELGGIDLSGGAYPATPQFATFWKVTVAGVVGGIPYGVGDTLVYSKNINQFYKIDNTESVSSVNGQTGAVAVEPTITAGTASQMWLGNKTWASVLSQVQGVLLTGLSLATGTPITSTDSVLSSLGKLQKQITDAAVDLAADVRAVALTGLSLTTGTAITATDSVLSGLGKLQKQITDAATNLAASVRGTPVTGFVAGTDTPVVATDSLLAAVQKLQGQVAARLSTSGGKLTGALVNEVISGSGGLSTFSNVGALALTVSGSPGAVKITLPYSWTSTMLSIHVTGYMYNTTGDVTAFEIILGGYNYSTGWVNCSAQALGIHPFDSITARFGHDGTNCCILLGTVSQSLNYPKVVIETVITGHSQANLNWGEGWDVSQVTSEAGITISRSAKIGKNSKSDLIQWQNYGHGHVIFDASAGTSPSGAAISNHDSIVPWTPTYPALMGWNGTYSYGVRVDSARVADNLVDSGWITPTLVNGWVSLGGRTLQYRKVGGRVTFRGVITNPSFANNNTIAFTIPAGYRSSVPLVFSVTGSGYLAFFSIVYIPVDTYGFVANDRNTVSGEVLVCVDSISYEI